MEQVPDLCNPTDAHRALREMVHRFGKDHVEPQAAANDEHEKFNEPLFRRLGTELSLFGLTVGEEDGGVVLVRDERRGRDREMPALLEVLPEAPADFVGRHRVRQCTSAALLP